MNKKHPLLADRLKIISTNINLLRFVGALTVILCHSYPLVSKDSVDYIGVITDGQCNLGGIAVAVFFFISGLYTAKSLERVNSPLLFLKKRCTRIFPQLWIVVIATIIMGAFITTIPVSSYFSSAQTYKYFLNGLLIPTHNLPGVFNNNPITTVNGPLWTLPVEFAAYFGLAIIFAVSKLLFKKHAGNKKKRLDYFCVAILAILFIIAQIKAPESMFLTAIRPMLVFYIGVIYYDLRNFIRLYPYIGILMTLALVFLSHTSFFNIGLVLLLPYVITSIALGLPQLKNTSQLLLISYEIYLVGWPIQQLLFTFLNANTPIINFLSAIPLSIATGYFVNKASVLIEKNIIAPKKQ